jgi:hypothetical protein
MGQELPHAVQQNINLKTAKTPEHDPEKWFSALGKDHASAGR